MPVKTGAFRHSVPETDSTEHPHFVMCWQTMFQSPMLADIKQVLVFGKIMFLTTLLVVSVLLKPQFFTSLIR